MRERVTIVENIAISSVQSICFFERRPSSKIAVRAFKPILRIWLAAPDGCSANALTQFALKRSPHPETAKSRRRAENVSDGLSHGHDTQPATNVDRRGAIAPHCQIQPNQCQTLPTDVRYRGRTG